MAFSTKNSIYYIDTDEIPGIFFLLLKIDKNHIFIARSEDIKRMLTVCLSICPRSFEESDQGHPTII